MKAMTIRIADDLYDDLNTVADCDGEPVSESVRAALSHWVAFRRADPQFQAALAARIQRAQRLGGVAVKTWLCWALAAVGYRIRPYDMLCDRRRWFWQERTRCRSIAGDPDWWYET